MAEKPPRTAVASDMPASAFLDPFYNPVGARPDEHFSEKIGTHVAHPPFAGLPRPCRLKRVTSLGGSGGGVKNVDNA